MGRKCDNCENPASWAVRLRFYPPPDRGGGSATADFALFVCGACRGGVRVEDLLTDAGWAVVCRVFSASRRVIPDRARTELEFVPIERVPPEIRGN